MSGWRERRHARKVRRLEDRLADTEHELEHWGFGKRPSEIRALEERIEKLERKLDVARLASSAAGKEPRQ